MAEQILMTALSPTMEEGTIITWIKQEGAAVTSGDILCEIETDKATMEYESTQEGSLLKILKEEGSMAKVGEPIAIIGATGEDIAALLAQPAAETTQPTEAPPTEASPSMSQQSQRIKASPLARKIAALRNIDLGVLQGSGPGGRIIRRDVEAAPTAPTAATAPAPAVTTVSISTQEPAAAIAPPADRLIPLGNVRAVIARRVSESKFSAPHFSLTVSVDMSEVIAGRSALNRTLSQKVSFNAFLIKFVGEALRRHPIVNSSWNEDSIRRFGSIDIGLAVDGSNGLVTPIVRNCAYRGVIDIDSEVQQLIAKATTGTLKPQEYSGATFTISNLGSFGIEEFAAIINPPGSAILAVGQTTKRVVVDANEEMTVKPMAKMTLSCDHRVIDGADGARFLDDLKRMMEHPIRALL